MHVMTALEPDDLGRVGYIAYGNCRGWTAYNGEPMPEWEELSGAIQQGWAEAAVAIANVVRSSNDR